MKEEAYLNKQETLHKTIVSWDMLGAARQVTVRDGAISLIGTIFLPICLDLYSIRIFFSFVITK